MDDHDHCYKYLSDAKRYYILLELYQAEHGPEVLKDDIFFIEKVNWELHSVLMLSVYHLPSIREP